MQNKTMKKNIANIVKELESRIAADLKPVDREAAFCEMLDECYSFSSVGGPFAYMTPSRVLQEMDPTAFRCGVNDFADGQEWVEVGTETYNQSEAEEIKETLADELSSQETDTESELDDARNALTDAQDGLAAVKADPDSSPAELQIAERELQIMAAAVTEAQNDLDVIRAQIAELEKHSF